ncbi:MAG: 50S ribosomal protein L11 methyltransferase [Bacteroidales bacterium]|jgi:ribosomal protein L11 methyltransferase|nr:50S ribosomal protein L11 methyltransferase [Bacteroidales bacterium]HOI31439.1 50S ribosomal protein L11 methyltransferase [Bacteroidales bacterium]
MSEYLEIRFSLPKSEAQKEILTAWLAESGCDSFMEDEMFFKAYCPEEHFVKSEIEKILLQGELSSIQLVAVKKLTNENWNANWEAAYEDVVIEEKCRIRAPFHEASDTYDYELIIAPKMSFGTAHHETTAQMIALMLDLDFNGLTVLDMGSGTAVLAVLAEKMGSPKIVAIDNDEWAYNNAQENTSLNNCANISVELGDASAIGKRKFDIILANINRNILLEDMPHYVNALYPNGIILFSGFYLTDLEIIQQTAEGLGLIFRKKIVQNNWVAVEFKY